MTSGCMDRLTIHRAQAIEPRGDVVVLLRQPLFYAAPGQSPESVFAQEMCHPERSEGPVFSNLRRRCIPGSICNSASGRQVSFDRRPGRDSVE